MTASTSLDRPSSGVRAGRGAAVGLTVSVLLIALAIALPRLTDWNVHVRTWPPLHADWDPRVGPGTVPAIVIALLSVRYAGSLAQRLAWGRLLLTTYVAGLAWMLALAFVDGRDGVGRVLDYKYEYLPTARTITDLPAAIAEYVDRIPFAAGDQRWPPHLAGHPPGALTFFVVLARIGCGDAFTAGLVVTLLAATTALGVMVTLRVLGAGSVARAAAPYLVLAPAAIWQCVSADAMFAAVAAWAVATLAVAATRRSVVWSVVSGLLFGGCVMLSYGLPLLGLPALAVLVVARSWRPLVPVALAGLTVVLVYAALGFRYWEALPVLHDRYWAGVARNRPESYWWWANLAVLSISAGPLVGAGLGSMLATGRSVLRTASGRAAAWLVASFALVVVVADATRMSKAETERIWLPFVPWLLVACAFLPPRWRTPGLALQVGVALVVQHLLATDGDPVIDLPTFYARYLARCNEHRFEELGEFVAEDVNGPREGLAAYAAGLRDVVTAFPDYRWELHRLLVDGDWLATRLTGGGTHRGPFRGIAPTGRVIRTQELVLYQVSGDRIVQCWGDLGATVRDELVSGG